MKTNNGADVANETAKSLDAIVSDVTKVSDLVAEIAAASHEQSSGISQVNEGLTQLDEVNQQTTSTSEESAAIAEELSSQTTDLQQMLQRFTLKGEASRNTFTPPAQRPMQTAQKPAQTPSSQLPHQPEPSPSASEWGGSPAAQTIKLDDDDFGKY